MAKKKIPGWVLILIGSGMALLSYFINKSQNTNGLTIFIYVGYLFIAYGVARVTIGFILKNEQSKIDKSFDKQLPEDLRISDNTSKTLSGKKHDLYGYIGYCPKCNTPMRRINIYCHRCGMKQSLA